MHRAFITIATIAALTALAAPADARRKGGPNGTFRNESGVIKLAYLGEGFVSVELKTRYCKLSVKSNDKAQANTFVPTEGIAVHDAKGKPVLGSKRKPYWRSSSVN